MPRSFEKKDEEEDKREGQGPALPSWQPEPEHGDLERFIRYCRTSKCPDFQAGHCELHKPMQCFHFHFEGQRRRGVLGLDGKLCYWELPCKWISQPNKCHLGERCIFAHSKGEISYHPAKYKTRLCNGGDCQKATCCFAHSEKELRSKAVARYSHGMAAERPKESKESKEQEEPKEEPKELKESDEGLSGGPRSLGASGSGATSANARSLEAVDLKTFKVFPCRKGRGVHDRKLCAFYHNPRDRRRPPACGYRPEPCPECFDSDSREGASSCSLGDDCGLCHSRLELLYHDSVFKKRFCATFPKVSSCQRGDLCAFAHHREEVRVGLLKLEEEELMAEWLSVPEDSRSPEMQLRAVDFFTRRFKTLWCPYGTQHSWHECLYAHTDQDWRRRPELGYSSEPCTEWAKHVGERLPYNERCPRGLRCGFAHGSKEQLYHPSYYKTMPCTDWAATGQCPRGPQCAFYHGADEQRILREASSPSAAVAGASMGRVLSVQELEASLAARTVQDVCAACATRLEPASVAGSVDGATTLSGRSGMRTSFGSLASLASLASSNSATGSPAVGPHGVPLVELEPAYVRLPPMWGNHGHLVPFPEDDEASVTKEYLRL